MCSNQSYVSSPKGFLGVSEGKNWQFTIWIYLLKLTYWWNLWNRMIGQSYSKIEANYSGFSLLQVWTVCWKMLGNMGRTCRFLSMDSGWFLTTSSLGHVTLRVTVTLWWTNILQWKDPPFLMGKSTISMAIFNCYVKLPEGRSISKGTTPRSLYFSLVKDYNSATSKHDDVQNTGVQVKLCDPFGAGEYTAFSGYSLVCFAYWCHLVDWRVYLMPENRCLNILYQLINEFPNPLMVILSHTMVLAYPTRHTQVSWLKKMDKLATIFGSKNGHKSTVDDLDDYGTCGHRIEPSNIFSNKINNQCDGLIQYFGVSEKKIPSGKLW